MRDRVERMAQSLEGLSVGDAFGERRFGGPPPWGWTDDTAMAISIVSILEKHGTINSDLLARSFADQYIAEPQRGYGPAMHTLLPQLKNAGTREQATKSLFGGQGSLGNGAAMRVAPLGAYFADDLDAVIEQARLSAVITHAHPEGIAGAVAVALAAAYAWQCRGSAPPPAHEFLDNILPMIPAGLVANGVGIARDMAANGESISTVINRVGNGNKVTAQDTVPFVLWSAATHLDNYEEAIWQTSSALGDIDTNCAIVGGIIVLYTGVDAIPDEWRKSREPLPDWIIERLTDSNPGQEAAD